MNGNRPLTDVEFWLGRQQSVNFGSIGTARPSWYDCVQKYLPTSPRVKCLEIGVVPGRTLLFFAVQHRYLVTGIDLSPKIRELREAFSRRGIDAEFIEDDFLAWKTNEKFDFVYSCGFVEHFTNYQAVIDKHWELVKPGGLMLITVPTMTPVQKFIRLIFYEQQKMQEILDTHNFDIMSLHALEQAVDNLRESNIMIASYASEMGIWFSIQEPGVRKGFFALYRLLKNADKLSRRIGFSSRWFSPEAVVLTQKSQ